MQCKCCIELFLHLKVFSHFHENMSLCLLGPVRAVDESNIMLLCKINKYDKSGLAVERFKV